MTWTNRRHLFKNKGNFVYNYKLKKFEHMSKTPMCHDYNYLQTIRKDLFKKYYIYYHRVSAQEGLNIDLNTSQLMLGNYNKEIYQKCTYCHCVIEIKKGFKENSFIRNICYKLIQNDNKSNPEIHIIWTENQKYRVFTNFYRSFVDKVFRRENIKDKCGEIS